MKTHQTLGEFIIQHQKDFQHSTGEFSRLLSAIKLASKLVNREVNKAGLVEDILGDMGQENVQGEVQKKLDVLLTIFLSVHSLSAMWYVVLLQKKTNFSYPSTLPKIALTANM